MASTELFIPDKIKVGFQKRSGTYNGMLAYVIYFDKKGVLRKELSWNSWRDQKIDDVEHENVPTEGFVLNKKVGGYKSDWNYRSAYVRIYDPRGFEFEITIENLLFILAECDCNKGKGLSGKFVYSWDGKDLVLLPVSSSNYIESQKYTKKQENKIGAKSLKIGESYKKKKKGNTVLTYLGHHKYYESLDLKDKEKSIKKKHVFSDGKSIIHFNNVSHLSEKISDYDGNLSKHSDLLKKHPGFWEWVSFELKDVVDTRNQAGCNSEYNNYKALKISDNKYNVYVAYTKEIYSYEFEFKNGVLYYSDTIRKYIDHQPYSYRRVENTFSKISYDEFKNYKNNNLCLVGTKANGDQYYIGCKNTIYKLQGKV